MSKKLLLIKQTDKDLYFSRNASNGNAKWTNSENMAYSYEPNEIQEILEMVEAETGIDCEIFEYNYQSFINGTTMITANNYFEEIKPIVSKLPAEVKEAHELVTAMLNDGIENPFATGDKDIDEMGELLLKKANEILSSNEPKRRDKIDFVVNKQKTKAEPKPKVAKPKNENRKTKIEKPAAKKAPAKKAAKSAKSAGKKTTKKAAKKTAKLVKKVVANVRKADKAKPAVTKTIFSKELELIKQFISINGKTIKRQTLQTKHNAIANALKEGKVTMHIAHLKNILSRYNRVLSNLATDTTEVRGSIEKGFLTTLKNVVAGAKIKVRTDVLGGVKKKGYRLLSPDGIDIERDTIYKTLNEVETAFNKWKSRYERQGYYSSKIERIDLRELADSMVLIDISTDDWEIYGDVINTMDDDDYNDLAGVSINAISKIVKDEIQVDIAKAKELFGFVGEGIYDIYVDSHFSYQTQEYTNELIILFVQEATGNIGQSTWKKVEQICESLNGKNGVEDYNIVSSHDKLVITFSEDKELVEKSKGLSGVNDTITCSNCGWSWDKNQTTKNEMYKCHHCGHDSSPKK